MDKIIYFDYAALVLLLFLIFSTVFRKMTKGISNRMFICVLITIVISTLFAIACIQVDNAGPANTVLLHFIHTGYLVFHNLTIPAYVMYVISLTDIWHKLNRSLLQQILVIVPTLLLIVALFVNIGAEIIYTVEGGIYKHTGLFWVIYAVAVYNVCVGVYFIIKYRRLLGVSKTIMLLFIVPMVMTAVVIQVIFPVLEIEMFATSLSLLLVSMSVQRPEEMIDTLTGLKKHSAYIEDIKRSFNSGKSFSLVMINIDKFSQLQTISGYESTIGLVSKTADIMEQLDTEYQANSELYYLDYGRFCFSLNSRRRDKAREIAEKLLAEINGLIAAENYVLPLVPHICVINCPEDAHDFLTLNSFASDFHKKSDSTGIVIAEEMFKQDKFEMMNNIDSIIDNALKKNSFKVYYQPIFSVEQGRFTSAEALLRLIDDKYGFVPPDLFIPAAEKSGAIHAIGDFVLDDVCRFIASDDFKSLGIDYIEINLSVAQCMRADLAEQVLATLKKYNLSSDKINLEITETAASYGQTNMKNNLDKLSSEGVTFSLDDYGTGYSNMKRVIQLPLKIVKLDKSFVDEQNNPKMWIVLQNTVKMLKDMNMEIVVEGIESQDMAEQFAKLNCDFIQGYFYSRPIPKDDFVSFVGTFNQENEKIH